MPDTTKQKRKELELEKNRLELRKAQLEVEHAERYDKIDSRQFHDRYTYEPTHLGEFRLEGPVMDKNVSDLTSAIERYAYLNDEAPIRLYLNTPGGGVLPGLALFDSLSAIRGNKHHITTIARGYAASMGAVLLQAGDERVVGPESIFMLHEISSGGYGKLHEMENELELMRKLNARLFDIVARRAGKKWTGASLYQKVKAQDWWLSAEETVKNGFGDRIG